MCFHAIVKISEGGNGGANNGIELKYGGPNEGTCRLSSKDSCCMNAASGVVGGDVI